MGRIQQSGVDSKWLKDTVQAGEYLMVLTNSRYRADGSVPGVIYCPALGAGAYNVTGWGPAYELARRGYPVICGDMSCVPSKPGLGDGAHPWGNDLSKTRLDAHKTFLQGVLGAKAGKIGLMYGSGGCPLAYAWAFAHPTDVYCIGGAIGVCNLEDVRANNRGGSGGYQVSIEAAYTNNAGWQAARATHNPVEIAGLAIPQLDYFSTNDPYADDGVHSGHDALAVAAGAQMTQRSLGAISHSTGPLLDSRSAESVAFCDWMESKFV